MKILTVQEFTLKTSELEGFSSPDNGMYFPLIKRINNSIISVGGDLSVKVFRTHLAPVCEEKEILIGNLSDSSIDFAHTLCI
jgi:hypothetical protein